MIEGRKLDGDHMLAVTLTTVVAVAHSLHVLTLPSSQTWIAEPVKRESL